MNRYPLCLLLGALSWVLMPIGVRSAPAGDTALKAWTETVSKRFRDADEPYPCWRGPLGSGAAIDTEEELVSCPFNARKRWASDVEIPGVHRMDRFSRPGLEPGPGILDPTTSGGFSAPVVAYRKVYLFYYRPNGGGLFEEAKKEYTEDSFTIGRRAWYTRADNVLHCFDADTGKTVWKRVFSRASINHNCYVAWKNGGHFTPCVADGRVFFYGPSARLYCVDAHSGQPLWQSDLGRRHEMSVQAADWWEENPNNLAPNGSWSMGYAPAYADGVVAISDEMEFQGGPRNYGGAQLAGYDADSGRPLWKVPGAMHYLNSPIRWRFEGKAYFISAGPRGIVCVEPRTGAVLWQIEEGGVTVTPAVAGPYLVGWHRTGLTCWRISPNGATELWSKSPSPPGFRTHVTPLIYEGRVYSRNAVLDLKTGTLLASFENGPVDEPRAKAGVTSPLGANGQIFCDTNGEKTLYALPAEPRAFAPSALSLDAGSVNSVSFAIAYDRVYFRNRWRLMCFDLSKRVCGLDAETARACVKILFSGDEDEARQAAAALEDVQPEAEKIASDAFARCRKSTNPLLRGVVEAIDARAEADGITMDVGMDAIDDGLPSLDGDFDF